MGLIAGTSSAALAAPTTFQYTFTNQNQNDSFIDVGLCDPGPATVMLIGFNEALHVSATESGLTEDQIWALLEDDPDGVIVRVTYTQTGQFIVEEASGVTYTGRFTSWFGGNLNRHTAEFGGTFSVRGTGDDGSRHGQFHLACHVRRRRTGRGVRQGPHEGLRGRLPAPRTQGPRRDLRERLILG